MVQRCCVPLCGTKVGDRDLHGTKVRFHRMPLTQQRLSQWQDKITDSHRFRPVLSINSRVCSKHFHKEDYITKPLDCSKLSSGLPLCKEAIPTRFKWSVDNCDISAPSLLPSEHFVTPSLPTVIGERSHFQGKSVLDIQSAQARGNRIESGTSNSNIIETVNTHNNTNDSGSNSDNIEPVSVITMGKGLNQETQCSIEDEKFKSEIHRKNTIIKQLLTKITDLEEEQKYMEEAIAELRAANQSFDNQIQELNRKNRQLEEIYRKCAKQHKCNDVVMAKANEPPSDPGSSKKNHLHHESDDNDGREPCEFPKGKRIKISSEKSST